ncbi:MAG: hypothetical protein LBM76_00350 [Mycoplasmataceae bacterium]|jgi:DNA polymerase-3 subunit delta'|nr:hypothetical protein [Mycoplasmataceae bacterium]
MNTLDIKKHPHSILVVETKFSNPDTFIDNYIKSIFGNDEKLSKKIDTKSYYDLIEIDGYKTTIKKEDIQNIINVFSKAALEPFGAKFYVIKGIENCTHQAINSLLIFLEEPTPNTYAIFTTRSLNLVLPTIRSRCQKVILKPELSNIDNELSEYKLSSDEMDVAKKLFFSTNDAISSIKSNQFKKLYDLANSIVKENKSLSRISKNSGEFKKLDYKNISLLLEILFIMRPDKSVFLTLANDIHHNPTKILVFNKIVSELLV